MESKIFARARRVFQNRMAIALCIVPTLLGTIFLTIGAFGVDMGMKNPQNSWCLIFIGVFSFIVSLIIETITEKEDISKNTKN